MTMEYHGWVVLATSQDEWSDGDFEEAVRQVEQVIRTLRPEDGHDPAMPEGELLPRVVYLKGIGVASENTALQVLRKIGEVMDRSYGEIVVFDDERGTPLNGGRRFYLEDGRLMINRKSHRDRESPHGDPLPRH
jgi:hypothetical protein